jgi:N-acetylglucosaminyl-diphospho-decaprenol L-rhamnosyltransferase
MKPSVRIVIVNWNTGDYLRQCLASIVAARSADITLERVTVVDNASSDSSASGLEEPRLPLAVVRSGSNIGFAAACNRGAIDSTADYLLFLNPDTRLFPDTLRVVTEFMESDAAAGIGICGAQILDSEGRPGISCARFPTLRVMFGKMTGLHRLAPGPFPSHHLSAGETMQSQCVDQVIGAFYFVRRDLFSELSGFDERYFLYFEEVDFALRALQRGARSYFLKSARVFHAANVSSDQVRSARLYHSLRSRLLFAFQHWSRPSAYLLVGLTLSVELGARIGAAAFRGKQPDIRETASVFGQLLREVLHWHRWGWPTAARNMTEPTAHQDMYRFPHHLPSPIVGSGGQRGRSGSAPDAHE